MIHTGEGDQANGWLDCRRLVSASIRRLREHWLLVLGLLAVCGLVIAVGPAKLTRVLAGADPRFLALMLPCVLALYATRGLAWRVALLGSGLTVTRARAIRLVIAGQALIFLPGGDLWRIAVTARAQDLRRMGGVITATIVFDDLVFMTLLSLALVPLLARMPFLIPLVVLALLGELMLWSLLVWPAGYLRAVQLATRMLPVGRLAIPLGQLGPAFRRLVRPRIVLQVGLLNAVAGVLSLSLFVLALLAVRVTWIGLDQAAFTLAAGQIVGSATMLPGGIGAYEAVLTGLLVAAGVAPATGAAAALLYRGFSDVLMSVLGVAAGIGLGRRVAQRDVD